MKLCLVLVVVAGLTTACAPTEQQQTTDTQQPASAPAVRVQVWECAASGRWSDRES